MNLAKTSLLYNFFYTCLEKNIYKSNQIRGCYCLTKCMENIIPLKNIK